tara:strand:+ start:104 stop:346 length:243 start_codon:yes stop_codon:yes gene_type:complete
MNTPDTHQIATINFMYFANNFSQSQLESVFESTNCPSHLKSKFDSYNGNGTEAFFKWFMLLDNDNKSNVLTWINDNYKNL